MTGHLDRGSTLYAWRGGAYSRGEGADADALCRTVRQHDRAATAVKWKWESAIIVDAGTIVRIHPFLKSPPALLCWPSALVDARLTCPHASEA